MARNCAYTCTDSNGNPITLVGPSALKTFLVQEGLETLFPDRDFTKLPVPRALADAGKADMLRDSRSISQFDRRQNHEARVRYDLHKARKAANARLATELRYAKRELRTNPTTGIPNKRAFFEGELPQFVASIDIDSLKYVNDNMGHSAGDDLLRIAARVLAKNVDAYHVSGDEIWAKGNDREALEKGLKDAVAELRSGAYQIVSDDAVFSKPGFSYGVAATDPNRGTQQEALEYALKRADLTMLDQKEAREKTGDRAPRGEAPDGFVRTRAANEKTTVPQRPLVDNLEDAKAATTFLAGIFGPGVNRLVNGGVVTFTKGKETWPETAKASLRGDEEAVYFKGRAYIDLNAITRERLPGVLLHEIGEHFNLSRMLGAKAYTALQNQIRNQANVANSPAAKVWAEVKRNYPHLGEGSEEFTAEVIAKLGERNPKLPWYRRLLAQIKSFLINLGLGKAFIAGTMTDKDLHALLVTSLKSAAKRDRMNEARLFDSTRDEDREVRMSRPDLPDTINIDGKDRPTRNSNGQPIHPTEEGIRNFYEWFKDSKVVDAEGRPLIVYHGTDKDFSKFDLRRHGEKDHGFFGVGHYFTPHADTASAYADYNEPDDGQNLIPVYLSIQKPFQWEQNKIAAKNKGQAQDVTDELAALGHDGVFAENQYFKGDNADMYEIVAFNANQIKSATGNTGAFSPDDADIRFSRPDTEAPASEPKEPSTWDKTKTKLANMGDAAFSERLAFLSAIQVADIAEKIIPYAKNYIVGMRNRRREIDTWLRKADQIVSKWRSLLYPERTALNKVIHGSTLADMDVSQDWTGVKETEVPSYMNFADGERYTKKYYAYTQAVLSTNAAGQLKDLAGRQALNVTKNGAEFSTSEQAALFLDKLRAVEQTGGLPTNVARKEKFDALRRDYEALPDKAKEVYRDTNAIHGELFEAKMAALEERIHDAIIDKAKASELIQSMRAQFESGSLNWYYAPLSRFGKHWFYGVDREGQNWFRSFESERGRNQAEKEFKALHGETSIVGHGSNVKDLLNMRTEGTSDAFILSVKQLLEDKLPKELSDDMADDIYQMYLSTLPDVSMRHNAQHRKGTLGFEEDALRSFGFAVHHGASQVANMTHGRQMQKVLSEMEEAIHITEFPSRRADMERDIEAIKDLEDNWEKWEGDTALHANIKDAKKALNAALRAGDPVAIDAAEEALNIAQKIRRIYNNVITNVNDDFGVGFALNDLTERTRRTLAQRNHLPSGVVKDALETKRAVAELRKNWDKYDQESPITKAKQAAEAKLQKATAQKDAAGIATAKSEIAYLDAVKAQYDRVKNDEEPMDGLMYAREKREHTLEIAGQLNHDNLRKAVDVLNELRANYVAMTMTNSTAMDQLAGFARQVGFTWMLGFGLSSGVMNMAQTPVVAIPIVMGKHGIVPTTKAFNAAYADFAKAVAIMFRKDANGKPTGIDADGNASMTQVYRDKIAAGGLSFDQRARYERLIQALERFKNDGTLSRTQTFDVIGVGQEGETYGGKMQEWSKKMGWMFHQAERANREITLVAAMNLALDKGMHIDDAMEYAKKVVDDAHGEYSPENAPRIFRGWLPSIALQFKKYPQMMLYLWGKTASDALSKWKELPPGPERDAAQQKSKEAFGTLGALFLAQVSVAGVFGLPMMGSLGLLLNALANAVGDDDEPDWDWQQELRVGATSLFGETAATALTTGFFNALTPANVGSRMSLAEPIFRPPLQELEGQDAATHYLAEMWGPFGGIIQRLFQSQKLMADGHYMRAAEYATPKFVGDAIKSFRFAKEGAQTINGEPMKDMSAMEELLQLAGFGSSELEKLYAERGYVKSAEAQLQERRKTLQHSAARAKLEGTEYPMADVVAWNEKHPNWRITAETVKQAMDRIKENRAAKGERGYTVNPKLDYLIEENTLRDDVDDE